MAQRKALPDHFDLNQADAYQAWRQWKLSHYPITFDALKVPIKNAEQLSQDERAQLQSLLNRYNMVIYACANDNVHGNANSNANGNGGENKQLPLDVSSQFGLQNLDANLGADIEKVTSIELKTSGVHGRYIPYTDAKLNWHTDGYYNLLSKQIRGMVLHCVRPAQKGGENALIDPEMAYILLRDHDPEYITALSQPDAMIIPANEVDGKILRAEQAGPVFSIDQSGQLHMRYTARKRHIVWKNNKTLKDAVALIESLCAAPSAQSTKIVNGTDISKWIIRGTLAAGEGLLCNNVLHNRSPFDDDEAAPRLIYRLRYLERIQTQYK